MRTLQQCQDELNARGVRDVKLCFDKDVQGYPAEQLKQHTARFMDAYLQGRYTKLPLIGDGVKA